jgi:hypothetical protein
LIFWIPLTGFIAWKLNSPIPILLAAILAALGGIAWWVHRNRTTRETPSGKET